jgi:hypothetical protein
MSEIDEVIRKAWSGGNKQILVSIPKISGIKPGDYVKIKKVNL